MSGDQQDSAENESDRRAGFGPPPGPGGYGGAGFPFGAPPPPPVPPRIPPGPADPLRAAAVALLNLSGLGLGYALIRNWLALAACWIATGILLLVALPADPDGVPGAALLGYLAVLVLAAVHGAVRGLRTPLSWPPRAPLAVLLGVVLLAVPAGGVASYDGARDEATEQMLLDRLDTADELVTTAAAKPFTTARPDYRTALVTYHDLDANHPDSRAAGRVPASMKAYYAAVGTPYSRQKYCDAIEPLTYLRTVPGTFGSKRLGSLADWPDDRLATSLYTCGLAGLGTEGDVASPTGNLGELLATFPGSPQAAKVEPAVSSAIGKAAKDVAGDQPCAATDRLRTLGSQARQLQSGKTGSAEALTRDAADADRKVQSGTYACGVDQYKDGDFDAALTTMNDFTGTYRHDRNRARAQKIAIAAEIAKKEPAAGTHLPSLASGGGIPVTISNDSPDKVEILYTGPVTGSFELKACGSCSTYSSDVSAQLSACKGSKSYPKRTITLPPGTTYFLHKSADSSVTTAGSNSARIRSGYTYTECAYVVRGLGSGYSS
ncbi:hypothetical protein [Streptomyces sp. NBC_00344]|uniref:hypothetical protein n=1 Tax=Streptomyces sp. NBC_00344 TaxID=2975720 RepID=UPI002E227103